MSLLLRPNQSLQPFNTLGIAARAAWLAELETLSQCDELPALARQQPLLVLGGGSNIVLAADFPGLVLLNRLRGIQCLRQDAQHLWVQVAGGESWDDFVQYSLEQGWFGLENLSAIPGTVGAAPVQNIGAYGVEVQGWIDRVGVFDWQQGIHYELGREACQFGYRDSLFKQVLRDRVLITHVVFRLDRQPCLRLEYGDIRTEIHQQGLAVDQITPMQLRHIIRTVRARKLPDPRVCPNVGSFFKNPVISSARLQVLQQQWPDIVHYPLEKGQVKLAAGWLIDRLGWKGRAQGSARVHERQALVLINQGADSRDLLALAAQIRDDVRRRFEVVLEVEPLIIGLA